MSNYISSYHFTTPSGFGGIAALSNLTGLYVAGGAGGRGTFTRLSLDGDVQWSRQYTLPGGNTISFSQVVPCDNGDFILYGSHSLSSNANDHLVVRVDGAGNVIWANTYHRATTRYQIKVVKSTFDTYFICAWHNLGGSSDDVEVIKINGSGTVLNTANLSAGDDQVLDMVAYGEGVAITGGTSSGPGGWDTFVVGFDKGLNILWSKVVGDTGFQQGRALTYLGNDSFTLSSEDNTFTSTTLIGFHPNVATAQWAQYDLDTAGNDSEYRRLVWDGTHFYHIGQSNAVNTSIVTKFSNTFAVVWRKRIVAGSAEILRGILWSPSQPGNLFLVGSVQDSTGWNSLLCSTDRDLESCVTTDLGVPARTSGTFQTADWQPTLTQPQVTVSAKTLVFTDVPPPRNVICANTGGTGIDVEGAVNYQSPYVYLQAAGSDGSDDSVPGIDLRWNFLRELGSQHIAKGNLAAPGGTYATSIAFNRPNDFVKLYRSPWQEQYQVNVDPNNVNSVVDTGPNRIWRFTGLTSHDPTLAVDVELRFMDIAQYDLLKATWGVNYIDILRNYTGVVELGTVGKLAFHYRFDFDDVDPSNPASNGSLRYEVISLPDALDVSTRQIYCREVADGIRPGDSRAIRCENIEYLRFDYRDGIFPRRIQIITYDNYISGTESIGPGWAQLGGYSLSIDNAVVSDRLHKSPGLIVDNTWRKFNEPAGGEFRVKTDNYLDRWSMPEGLREAVVSYLTLSVTDPLAVDRIPNSDPLPNNSEMDMSYLDMLQMVGLDYHVARMLGFGHIDTTAYGPAATEYVYLMGYVTEASLDGAPATIQTHLYMTPPLNFTDYKLPPAPALEPVEYGLYLDNNTGNPTLLTDPQGYSPYAPVRFINLKREKFRHELPMEPFFYTPEQFCMCRETIPVGFGVEYGDGGIGSGGWVRPELSNDDDYQDHGGLNEVVPILDTGENPAFIHQETQNGVHHYALYSINWFSRVSQVGNEVETDFTQFPPHNTLLPPFNFQVQLIQPESPRIFTTQDEQDDLTALAGPDKTMVRVTFDWDDNHNRAYQYADQVEVLWRNEPPSIVRGAIQTGPGSVVEDPINHTVTVKTTSFTITSTSPVQVVQPDIPVAAPYVGGRFVVNGDAYLIEQVLVAGVNPTLVLKQIRSTYSQDLDLDGVFETSETWAGPAEGDRFIITENMDQTSSWDINLAKKINLANFGPVHTETVTHEDGLVETVYIGGMVDNVTIKHVYDPDPLAPANTPTGVYELTFATQNLPGTGDPDVDFYGGKLRCFNWANNEIKTLKVWSIDTAGPTLKLVVYDADFVADPIIPATPIQQTGRWANFHPSYRAYFYAETPFDTANVMAAAGEGTRETFMAARSKDTGNGLESYMTPAAVLLAREIITPVPPGIPTGPLFATRPNFYGKATYTFDVEVDNPFSLIFYRASERRILDALYQPLTVQTILAEMAAMSPADAAFNQDRWSDLANGVVDASFQFKEYVPGGFRFKVPDNNNYEIPDPTLPAVVKPFTFGHLPGSTVQIAGVPYTYTMHEAVKDAINGAFLPLTEIPAVYAQLAQNTMQTSGKAPLWRTPNGDRMLPGTAGYDPWPMAIRYEKTPGNVVVVNDSGSYGNPSNTRYVRFTDYTLDGSSTNIYFYFAVELSNTLAVSDRSPVMGPISLVNSYPAEAPGVKKITTRLENPEMGISAAVIFEMNEFVPSERIKQLEIYRSTGLYDELTPRTMDLVKVINVGDPVIDDFSDLSFPPFGDPTFYRIIARREILNEQAVVEMVPSKPTEPMLVGLVDIINPEPPALSFTSDPPTVTTPVTLHNCVLSWPTTCHNGTYHLYKQSSAGTWTKIHSVTSNAATITVPLATTDLASGSLAKQDADLVTIYHRFRVQVVNSSGLLNRRYDELTV